MRLCSNLLKNKQKDHIYIVDRSALKQHLPVDCIPQELGGKLAVFYFAWIDECMLTWAIHDRMILGDDVTIEHLL